MSESAEIDKGLAEMAEMLGHSRDRLIGLATEIEEAALDISTPSDDVARWGRVLLEEIECLKGGLR